MQTKISQSILQTRRENIYSFKVITVPFLITYIDIGAVLYAPPIKVGACHTLFRKPYSGLNQSIHLLETSGIIVVALGLVQNGSFYSV